MSEPRLELGYPEFQAEIDWEAGYGIPSFRNSFIERREHWSDLDGQSKLAYRMGYVIMREEMIEQGLTVC